MRLYRRHLEYASSPPADYRPASKRAKSTAAKTRFGTQLTLAQVTLRYPLAVQHATVSLFRPRRASRGRWCTISR